jgi:hypothetical protein
VALVAALAAALVGSATGIAGAAGLLPESFTGPLAFWERETNGGIDVQTARRVAQAPGPDGTVLSVWSARAADNTTCIAPMFEAPGPLDRPPPADFDLAGGQCSAAVSTVPFGTLGGSTDGRRTHTMWATAGQAVRAEVRMPDGSTRSALRAEGMFFLWYVADAHTPAPVLVGYDGAGRTIGPRPLPNLSR